MSTQQLTTHLGKFEAKIEAAIAELHTHQILPRIWKHDHTVWQTDPTEITNRLGWLRIAENMQPEIVRLTALAAEVRQAGFETAVLLGMGGSSLAPEVIS